jgi:hypothetical protein
MSYSATRCDSFSITWDASYIHWYEVLSGGAWGGGGAAVYMSSAPTPADPPSITSSIFLLFLSN